MNALIKNKLLLLLGTSLLIFSGCGGGGDSSTSPISSTSGNTTTDIQVERGKVYDATVTDSSVPTKTATQKGNTNVYTFTGDITYPIKANGGWIDVNNDGSMDSDDLQLKIEMVSYSKVITPTTTYIADSNETIRNQKVKDIINAVSSDLGNISIDELLNKVPSESSIGAIILANSIYKNKKASNNFDKSSIANIANDIYNDIAANNPSLLTNTSLETAKSIESTVITSLLSNGSVSKVTNVMIEASKGLNKTSTEDLNTDTHTDVLYTTDKNTTIYSLIRTNNDHIIMRREGTQSDGTVLTYTYIEHKTTSDRIHLWYNESSVLKTIKYYEKGGSGDNFFLYMKEDGITLDKLYTNGDEVYTSSETITGKNNRGALADWMNGECEDDDSWFCNMIEEPVRSYVNSQPISKVLNGAYSLDKSITDILEKGKASYERFTDDVSDLVNGEKQNVTILETDRALKYKTDYTLAAFERMADDMKDGDIDSEFGYIDLYQNGDNLKIKVSTDTNGKIVEAKTDQNISYGYKETKTEDDSTSKDDSTAVVGTNCEKFDADGYGNEGCYDSNSERTGLWTHKRNTSGKSTETITYINGIKNGPYTYMRTEWNEKTESGSYLDGLKDGVWNTDDSGYVTMATYKNGVYNGLFESTSSNSTQQGNYISIQYGDNWVSRKDGIWTGTSYGKEWTRTYDNGSCISGSCGK